MRIGIGLGPNGAPQHESTHYVYDVRSGVILGAHHFVGAAPKSESERLAAMLKSSHEASGIPLENLAVLTSPEVPAGESELHVDHSKRQMTRKSAGHDPRIRL